MRKLTIPIVMLLLANCSETVHENSFYGSFLIDTVTIGALRFEYEHIEKPHIGGTAFIEDDVNLYLDIVDVKKRKKTKTILLGEDLNKSGTGYSFIWPYLVYAMYKNSERSSLFMYNFENGTTKWVTDSFYGYWGLSTEGKHILYNKGIYIIDNSQPIYTFSKNYEPLFYDDKQKTAIVNCNIDYGRERYVMKINIETGKIDTTRNGYLFAELCGFGKYVSIKENISTDIIPWGYRVFYSNVEDFLNDDDKSEYTLVNDNFDIIEKSDIDPGSGYFSSFYEKGLLYGRYQANIVDTIYKIK